MFASQMLLLAVEKKIGFELILLFVSCNCMPCASITLWSDQTLREFECDDEIIYFSSGNGFPSCTVTNYDWGWVLV